MMKMLTRIDRDLKIPFSLVPQCPVCWENMEINLRCDNPFVEDDVWHQQSQNYEQLIHKYKEKISFY